MKIKADFYKAIKEKTPKSQTINIEVQGETFQVEVKNFLTGEEKIKMSQRLLEFIDLLDGEPVDVQTAQILGSLVMYEAITDIEFPEDLTERMEQFTWLAMTGVLQAVRDITSPELLEQLTDHLQRSLEGVAEQMTMDLETKKQEEDKKVVDLPKPIGRPVEKK